MSSSPGAASSRTCAARSCGRYRVPVRPGSRRRDRGALNASGSMTDRHSRPAARSAITSRGRPPTPGPATSSAKPARKPRERGVGSARRCADRAGPLVKQHPPVGDPEQPCQLPDPAGRQCAVLQYGRRGRSGADRRAGRHPLSASHPSRRSGAFAQAHQRTVRLQPGLQRPGSARRRQACAGRYRLRGGQPPARGHRPIAYPRPHRRQRLLLLPLAARQILPIQRRHDIPLERPVGDARSF